MSHDNRGRLTVDLGGNWRIYTHKMHGFEMLGTVQRGMEIGALAQSPAGILAQINAGAIRSLDQRKAQAAIASNAKTDAHAENQS